MKKLPIKPFLILFICLLFKDNIVLLLGNINNLLFNNNYQNEEIAILKLQNQNLINNYNNLNDFKNKLSNLDNYNYLISQVLLRNYHNFQNQIIIEFGKNKGLKNGMGVTINNNLIGIINKLNNKTSVVKLLTSGEVNISVKVNSTYGILTGYKNGFIVEKIDNKEIINIGDMVYTSGVGNLPENLIIGQIIKVEEINLGIEKKVLVKPLVDYNKLQYLIIIKDLKSDL